MAFSNINVAEKFAPPPNVEWEKALQAAIDASEKPLCESRKMERQILLAMPVMNELPSDLRGAVVDLAMALGELGKLPRENQAYVLKAMKSFGAYLGTFELREMPRMRWYDPALIWSVARVSGQEAEFFNFSSRGRDYEWKTNLPIDNYLPKDVQFEARVFQLFEVRDDSVEVVSNEEMAFLASSIEVSELVPPDMRSQRTTEFYRSVRFKNGMMCSGPPAVPLHPVNRRDAEWMRNGMVSTLGFQTPVFSPNLVNRKISWRMRTVGTNRLDGHVFMGVLVGRVLADERKENEVR